MIASILEQLTLKDGVVLGGAVVGSFVTWKVGKLIYKGVKVAEQAPLKAWGTLLTFLGVVGGPIATSTVYGSVGTGDATTPSGVGLTISTALASLFVTALGVTGMIKGRSASPKNFAQPARASLSELRAIRDGLYRQQENHASMDGNARDTVRGAVKRLDQMLG